MIGRSLFDCACKCLAAALIAWSGVALGARSAQAHTEPGYEAERAHVVSRARSEQGAPYRYGGSTPHGFDCSGFTRWVFASHGANLPHSSMAQFNLGKRNGFRRIHKRANLEPGDLVFHKTTSARVGHTGIYIGEGRFMSSTSSGGVQVRSIYDPYYWGPRWVAGTRVPATRRY